MKKHKMTKRLILALGIIGLSVTGGRADSVNEKEITYADPTIYVENGKYYLTGTRNQEPHDINENTINDATIGMYLFIISFF